MEQTPEGEIRAVERARLEHDDKDAMRAWLSRLDPEIPVALEATFGWPWVADLLEELGYPVHLGHPPESYLAYNAPQSVVVGAFHAPYGLHCLFQAVHFTSRALSQSAWSSTSALSA